MNLVRWLYTSADPLMSGELRRLGLVALALEGSEWQCTFTHIGQAGALSPAAIYVVPIEGLEALIATEPAGKIIVEVTQVSMNIETQTLLASLADRIDWVVARSRRSADLARAALKSRAMVSLIADPAERATELAAAALRFGLQQKEEQPIALPEKFELWFAEPGDFIETDEISLLQKRWSDSGQSERVAVAPEAELRWLTQAGITALKAPWTPKVLKEGIRKADFCTLPFTNTYSFARRRRKAHRALGLTQGSQGDPLEDDFDPLVVAEAWRGVLNTLVLKHEPGEVENTSAFTVLLLLDLIQDLDLALPLIEELRSRAGARLRIVVSTWLALHSPRVMTQLGALNLLPELVDRAALEQDDTPQLNDVRAVVSMAESSLPPHRRAHRLFLRAKALGIPTFSFQHGVENIGLNYFEQPQGQGVEITSDHLFVWFAPTAPVAKPAALKPKLLHVGRPRRPHLARHLGGVLLGFDRIGGVFENLHWSRFDNTYRQRFIEDLVALAQAESETAILLKPHHAGLWSVRNRQMFPDWPSNLIMADPTDPFWEPFTAPALIEIADFVITTPSTVALDAASAAKPVAVVAYDLDLPAYVPLPFIRSSADWYTFVQDAGSAGDAQRRSAFLDMTVKDDDVARVAVDHIVTIGQRRAHLAAQQQSALLHG